MSTWLRIMLSLALIGAPAAIPATAAQRDAPEPVLVRPFDPSIPTARTYFIGATAADRDAIDFRIHLIEAGARNVNLFLPDRVIVCDLPATPEIDLRVPPGFERASAPEVEGGAVFMHRPWSWINAAYQSVDARRSGAAIGAGLDASFKDEVITITPGRTEEIERNVAKSRALRGLAPESEQSVAVSAGSSFLGGSVLANFIFPESNGDFEANTENWSDADLTAAKQGAAEAMLHWQGVFPAMDLNFVLRMFERVATGYEPIQHSMRDDPEWVIDALRTLGYGQTNDMIAEVHEFNQELRSIHGTQWVFSAFIASSRNSPNYKFGGGSADYTAYAFLGGPFMIEPYPAGVDINGVGERLVYSQIVNHEVGHCFWTLDEYPGAPGSCGNSSGYLNYANGNLSISSPGGGELRCNALQNCIMHVAARQDFSPRPWCRWSEGHLGVIDQNANAFPDIFEAAPKIEFLTAGADTVTTNQYALRFRVTSQAVPNRNPKIAPDKRVNYALPLRRAWLSLNPETRVLLTPIDGRWDEVIEDCEFQLQLAQSGSSAFAVTAENKAGVSGQGSKVVHFVGVDYTRMAVRPKHNRNEVTWEIAGDPFGAKFDVYRSEAGQGFRIINDDYVGPSGPPRNGFIPYLYHDHDIVPGRNYNYFIRGHVWLAYEDSTREYQTESRVIGQTAMIPFTGDVISNIAPNPSRGPVSFSLQLPRVYSGPETAPVREPTQVDVAIYSVRGELVRRLIDAKSFDDVMTLHWDGNDQSQRPLPSGVYFVRVLAGSTQGFRKIVLLR